MMLRNYHIFKNFNWEDLLEYKVKPPHIPEVREWKSNLENCNYLFEEFINVYFKLKIGRETI
jgi:hypothetical protein